MSRQGVYPNKISIIPPAFLVLCSLPEGALFNGLGEVKGESRRVRLKANSVVYTIYSPIKFNIFLRHSGGKEVQCIRTSFKILT